MSIFSGINWSGILTSEALAETVRSVLLLIVGLPLLYGLSSFAGRLSQKRLSPQAAMLVRKGVFYSGFVLIAASVLYQMGFKLTALFGAAGIAGIAIGFASQTSVSNIISGIFLISEKPFEVGDLVKVGQAKGTVMSIDLLSVKLRTFDNQFIRIPNESIIKNELINVTRFPIRRVDIHLGVAYKENTGRVEKILMDIASANPSCLDEPKPIVRFLKFGDSALEFLFAVWCIKEDYFLLYNQIMHQVKERFDAEGIEIPFPHRTLYTGSETAPFPITVVREKASDLRRDGGD